MASDRRSPAAAGVTNVLFVQGGSTGAYDADALLAASLRAELGSGFELRYPAMVDEDEPDVAAWGRQIDQELDAMLGDTIVVGHSIGASVLLKHLSEREPHPRVRGIFLLSTPSWGVNDFWHWPECTLDPVATRRLTRRVPVALYHSVDDEAVPFSHLERNTGLVPGASIHEVAAGGHQYANHLGFLARDIRQALGVDREGWQSPR